MSSRAARPPPAWDRAAKQTTPSDSTATEAVRATSGASPKPLRVPAPAASRPPNTAARTAIRSRRGRSTAARSIGALSIHEPTAGETKTGPNSRASASTTTRALKAASHGSAVRASWQPPVVHDSSETSRRLTRTLTTIDPSIRIANAAT